MLQKLLLPVFLFCAACAIAQPAATPVKNTEKQPDPQIDYTLPGAPMPEVRHILYKNAIVKKDANKNAAGTDTAVTKRRRTGKNKKQDKDPTQGGTKTVLTNDDLDNGANLFVMIFNPECGHCQEEAAMIENNSALFKRSKVVLMANPVVKPYLVDFIAFTRVDQYASFMYLGIDSADFTKKVFLYKSLPQINIYDKHRKLIKTYNGEIAIDSLREYIQ